MTADTDTLRESFTFGTSVLCHDELTKQMNVYLLGYPISHSLAPLLHDTLYKQVSVPWTYHLLESRDHRDLLFRLKHDNCIGAAVTMPHKISFMDHVDELTDEARVIGAINTVFIRHDSAGRRRYIGTNTDCIGVREAFLQTVTNVRAKSAGKAAMVLGGGGACRSSVYALWKWLGVSKIYLVNRLKSEVDEVLDLFCGTELGKILVHVSTLEQAQSLDTPYLMVGTIPDLPPVLPNEKLARDIVVTFLDREDKGVLLEMCYHPKPVTELYRLAEGHRWHVIPGTVPMIHQGIAQEVLWMERPLKDFDVVNATRVVKAAMVPSKL